MIEEVGKQVPRQSQKRVQCWEAYSLCVSKYLLHGSAKAWRLEDNESNNCTGNYSIKHPMHHPRRSFSLHSVAAAGGLWGSESSLGRVLRDPVIWLDMSPLSLGQTKRVLWRTRIVLLSAHNMKKHPAATSSDLKPHNDLWDKTNYYRKRMVIKIKERVVAKFPLNVDQPLDTIFNIYDHILHLIQMAELFLPCTKELFQWCSTLKAK